MLAVLVLLTLALGFGLVLVSDDLILWTVGAVEAVQDAFTWELF
ncbi:hypothetical protein ACOBQX_08745 [Actinokineospora sp. G85]